MTLKEHFLSLSFLFADLFSFHVRGDWNFLVLRRKESSLSVSLWERL
jgi:hypothetical protein